MRFGVGILHSIPNAVQLVQGTEVCVSLKCSRGRDAPAEDYERHTSQAGSIAADFTCMAGLWIRKSWLVFFVLQNLGAEAVDRSWAYLACSTGSLAAETGMTWLLRCRRGRRLVAGRFNLGWIHHESTCRSHLRIYRTTAGEEMDSGENGCCEKQNGERFSLVLSRQYTGLGPGGVKRSNALTL